MGIIDNTRRVKVTTHDGRTRELLLSHREGTGDVWEVESESGLKLGTVEKTSYTYSPPTHRGSRIARYHKQVPAWQSRIGLLSDSRRLGMAQTRKEALIRLLTESREREALLRKLRTLSHRTRKPVFRLNRGSNAIGAGWTGTLEFQGPMIFINDRARPEIEQKQRVLYSEIDSDVRPCLEIYDARIKEFCAVANILWGMED